MSMMGYLSADSAVCQDLRNYEYAAKKTIA